MRKCFNDIEGAEEASPISTSIVGTQYQSIDEHKSQGVIEDKLLESQISPYLPPCANGHYPCLDVVRILCVWLACVDHGGTSFGHWNTMYVQSWVLQYLFYVCGFCYAMSSRDIWGYTSRLAIYFVVGTSLNCTAWSLLGMNWRSNIFGAVFQFWFIFALMLFLFTLTPLKRFLRSVRDDNQNDASSSPDPGDAGELGKGFAAMVIGCVFIKVLYEFVVIPICIKLFAGPVQPILNDLGDSSKFWGINATDHKATAAFIHQFFSDAELSVSNIFIAFVFPMLSKKLPFTLWLVLLNTYIHKCLLYRSQTTRMLNSFDATLMGVVFFYCGFAGRRVIGEYLIRYWFMCLFMCSLLWAPGMYGRLDESPPLDLPTRASYNFLEFCFAVLFFSGIERMVDPKIFSKDRLQFMGHWSLLTFLVHKFLVMLVQPMEYWLIMFTLIPVCKVVTDSRQKPKGPLARTHTSGQATIH